MKTSLFKEGKLAWNIGLTKKDYPKTFIICMNCGKEKKIKPSEKDTAKYCSKECKWEYESKHKSGENNSHYKERVIKYCLWCGRKFEVIPSHAYRRECCTRKCGENLRRGKFVGKNNPCYKERIIKYCLWCGEEYLVIPSQDKRTKCCSRFCQNKRLGKIHSGENHHNWQGGITKLMNAIRSCSKMDAWRKAVFKRDEYKDVITGEESDNLNAHHIIGLAELVDMYNITTLEEALLCDAIWDIDNGMTLTRENHMLWFHTSEL